MYKKKKPKYTLGGFLGDNAEGIGAGAGLVGAALGGQGGGLGVLGGIGSGVAAGSALGPPGMIIGGLVGGLTSIFGDNKKKQLEEQQRLEAKRQKEEQAKTFATNLSKSNLAGYSTYGNTDQYYAKGGNIVDLDESEYEVESGEVVQGNAQLEDGTQLSSDMHLVGGNKHENGGTEGIGGERVYSDRLKLGKAGINGFKSYGIGLKNNATFADVAKKIGQIKGKAEKKIQSNISPSIRTGFRMLEDHDEALDILFNIQETMKPNTISKTSFATGGKLPKQLPQVNTTTINPSFTGINNLVSTPRVNPVVYNPSTSPNFGTQALDWLGNNSGQLINAASYLSNLNSIKKLDTNVSRTYLNTPNYNYNNRSQVAKNDNLNAYRTTVAGLTSSSAGVTGSNTGAIYAATLDANSRINNDENQRRDSYNENYNQRTDRINNANTMIRNEASDMERTMLNEKNVAMPLQARNAFLQGYAGNTAMSQKNNLDKQRMLLSAYLNDENGVLSRIKEGDIKKLQNLPIYSMFNK